MNPDGSYGQPKQDLTLQDPHCVFQLIKKQFSYYTPEVVAGYLRVPPSRYREGRRAHRQELRA